MSMTLFELTAEMAALEETLTENGGEMTPELAAAYEQTVPALRSKVDSYDAVIQKFTSVSDSCDKMIARYTAMKKTAQRSVASIKEHLLYNMDALGVDKLEGSACKFSIRQNAESLDVNEEQALEKYAEKIDELRRSLPDWASVTIKIDKTAIKRAGKETGVYPVGCTFSRSRSLIIK